MRLDRAIGIALLCAAGAGAPLCAAQGQARPAAERTVLRTFTIVAGEDSLAGSAAFHRVARLATQQLEKKGYRLAGRGQVPDMVVKLSYRGKVLRYRAADLQFVSRPAAVNTSSASEPYPYPAGSISGARDSRPLSFSPAELDMFIAVEISSADGRDRLFGNSLSKRLAPRSVDSASRELVEAALQDFPRAKS